MRTYFRDPRWELRPPDDLNYVPVFHAVDDRMQYRVGCPFPFVVDPTRKLHNAVRVLEFKRDQVRGVFVPLQASVAALFAHSWKCITFRS